MPDHLVSVIIIFLNGEPFLAEAIDSVLAQTYPHWELLLVDDGSSDNSAVICQKYLSQRPSQIHYLHHLNLENRGMSASRNLGIAHAQGDYIAFLDADDVWLPHKLAEQVAIMQQYPQAGMVYGRTQIWHSWADGDDTADHCLDLGVTPNRLLPQPQLFFTLLANKAQTPTTCNALMRREVVAAVGGFEPAFRGMYEDAVFFSKIELHTAVYVADALWARYRQHPDSHSNRAEPFASYYASRRPFLEWLAGYVARIGFGPETAVAQAIQIELWRSRHPRLSQVINTLKLLKWRLQQSPTAVAEKLRG